MSVAACAEITFKGDPDRFRATMAGPVAARAILFPLYAMNVEVSRAPWVTQEPLIAEMRLQWWRDALDGIAQGKVVRKHEVTTPLSSILKAEHVPPLNDLIDARRWDIGDVDFVDDQSLWRHIDQTSGNLMQVAADLLGGGVEVARDVGFAQGAAAWLKAVPGLIAHKRTPLPGDPARSAKALAEEGLRRLGRARASHDKVPKSARPAFWTCFDASMVLKAAQNPDRVMAGDVVPSEFTRRARLLWMSASGRW